MRHWARWRAPAAHQPGDGEGAAAVRGDRPGRVRHAGRDGGFQHGQAACGRRRRDPRQRRHCARAHAHAESQRGLSRRDISAKARSAMPGRNALARARLAGEIIRERIGGAFREMRIDLIGSTSLHGRSFDAGEQPYEIRLRVAARADYRRRCRAGRRRSRGALPEWSGGGGGARKYVSEQVGIASTLIDREAGDNAASRTWSGPVSRRLYDVAHCRAGDKGNTSILSLIAYRADDYPLLVERVTVDAVAQPFARHRSGRDQALRAAASVGAAIRLRPCARRRRHDVARRSMPMASH